VVPAILLLLAPSLLAASPPQMLSVQCGNLSYNYVLSVPDGVASPPAIMVLHGAGGVASEMTQAWQPLATANGIVLIAPQLPRGRWFEDVAPAVFRCVIADAHAHAAFDASHTYLFGYSMGGYLAFDGALLASDLFAAVTVYAAAIAPAYDSIVTKATHKVPVAMYVGDHDPYFPVATTRRTRDVLLANGFTVRYTEYPEQGHAFPPISERLQRDAWAFMSPYGLPTDP
jgi:dienelactone hydrolase